MATLDAYEPLGNTLDWLSAEEIRGRVNHYYETTGK